MMKPLLALLLATISLLFLSQAPPAYGATITVNSTADVIADDGACTLREAITAANTDTASSDTIGGCAGGSGADVISFGVTGTIILTSGQLTVSDDLTIDGPGAANLTISGNSTSRVLTVIDRVTLSNITIANGFEAAAEGGGIRNLGTLNVNDVIVFGNSAEGGGHGGGIANRGALTISNTTLSDNTSKGDMQIGGGAGGGGAIFSTGGSLTVINSTFSRNSAQGAGGGILNNDMLTIAGSTLAQNSAALFGPEMLGGFGGGVANFGTLDVTTTTVSGNSAEVGGGGVFSVGTLNVASTTFSGNSSAAGGGINKNGGSLTISNSSFSGNSASGVGGGITTGVAGGADMITNSTFFGNSAGGVGGGIHNDIFGILTLENTIVANSASGGNCSGTITSAGHNIDSGSTCGLDSDSSNPDATDGDWINTDPMLGPLALNPPGTTETHALLPGSPAIDAGSPDCPPPATDQRGVSRPQGAACDIGAFELEAVVTAVDIDIKPGSDPNCIKNTNKGFIPVAVLGNSVDVTTIDLSTIEIDDDDDPGTTGVAPAKNSYRDVNGDSKTDLLLHFRTPELNTAGLLVDGNELFVPGELTDGTPIVGSDHIFLAGGPNCLD